MIRLDDGSLRRTRALIERYGIHREDAMLPVPILQIARNEGWRVDYRGQMGGMIAMGIVVGPVKLMLVNENLTEAVQRVGIAHEMAHILCQHGLSLDTKMTIGHEAEGLLQSSDVQEQEAILVGAMLLVPEELMLSPFPNKEVALLCQATPGAVREYRAALFVDTPAVLMAGA
jgi:Zn-dependent peptidase ImmA (M78 family)